MTYLFDEWHEIANSLKGSYIYLFLDYDGTITPIARRPSKAVASRQTRSLLRALAKNPMCRLAIISGRALKDIKRMVGVKEIIYAGNHGLEIEGPKIKFAMSLSSGFKALLRQIKARLHSALSATRGVLIEDKGLSLSVHYRLAEEPDEKSIKNIFYGIIQPYRLKNQVKVTFGKKVFEVRPSVKWDKGKAALWLLARQKFIFKNKEIVPIYVGDDITDEDAFKVLKNIGLTISVGASPISYAQYYLKETGEVMKLLRLLVKEKRDEMAWKS